MRINAVTSIKYNNQSYHIQNTAKQHQQVALSGVYNPMYYQDYNLQLSFGKRSPEDFYAQDFNRKNMPETMKRYLYTKFDEKRQIAPVQIMQEAFENLREAHTVADIKREFPDEPKFQKLKPANYSGATVGILKKIKDIKAMQETPEPLFKDGTDDLTTYLVKKIYLEGKTVKEIDRDFASEINPIYELAARVTEEAKNGESVYFSRGTIYNLGIRFPEKPFWNSFIATRDDYTRIRRIKTDNGEFVNADSPEGKAEIARRANKEAKPHRYNFKRKSIEQISNNIVNAKGETKKALKQSNYGIQNAEELTFFQKYWSQIMSIATEKIHLSEEMIDFNNQRKVKLEENILDKFVTGQDLNKREQTPFKIFWNERPELKKHFSTAITDTALLFSREFGADGNNPEFRALIEYAESIRPTREAQKLEHARIQAEYDEMARKLDLEEQAKAATPIEKIKQQLERIQPKQQMYEYTINGRTITIPRDIKAETIKAYEDEFTLVPRKLIDTYLYEIRNHVGSDIDRFYLSTCYMNSENIDPIIKELVFTEHELEKISDELITTMELKHNPLLESSRLAMFEFGAKNGLITDDELKELANKDILDIKELLSARIEGNTTNNVAKNEIQAIFNQYSQPLTKNEKMKLKYILFDALKNYDITTTGKRETAIGEMLTLLSDGAKECPTYANHLKRLISNDSILEKAGSAARYLLKENQHPIISSVMADHILRYILFEFPEECSIIMVTNRPKFYQLMAPYPQDMKEILNLSRRIMAQAKQILK